MIRFLLVAIVIILFLIFSIPIILIEKIRFKADQDKSRHRSLTIVRKVFSVILFISGVKVIVKGRENIPEDQAALYIGNHRSYFDILLGYTLVPNLMGFVAKKEMEKIPLLSTWMKMVCCIFLDRKDIREGLKTILLGIEYVKQGISIWIFPEGTRNTSNKVTDLLEFKEGSLKIAEKSGCPIIPVAITGSDDIYERHHPLIRPNTVTVEFGKPIILKELDKEQKKFAGAYTRNVIIKMLED